MGFLSLFKNKALEDENFKAAVELRDSITELEAVIRNDWVRRVYGDGIYSGYNVLREFYKGQQWSYKKEGGGTMRTYNYCFTVVENMTAFLTNEAPQMSSPPRKIDDSIERVLAEGRTKILNEIHEDNNLSLVFQRAARTASINGDAFIFGAIPVFKTDENGKKIFDRIKYWNVERPETIRPIWRDENFNEMSGFIKHYRISVAVAKKLFKEEIEKNKFQIVADHDFDNTNVIEPTDIPMVTVKEYWDENQYLLMFNADNKIVHYVKHDWGFLPLQYVPNIHLPGEPKGTSDIENELDAQQEYNERASDLADIIKEVARPAYWGKNLDNLTEVRSGQTVIFQVGEDGEIQAMPKSGQTVAVEQYLQDRKNDIISLSGQNQVLYPGSNVLQATGRALSVVMQGVNNKISLRKDWWVKAFKDLNKTILYHVEKQITGADLVINGFYKTDVFISSVLLRNVVDEINKFNSKIQSLTTTQNNVGIANPSEEQKLMKEELQDEILSTEISKQPGLLHQIIASRMAAATQTQPGNQPQQGAIGQVAGQSPAISNESTNTPGENPASAQGVASPLSPQGAVNMMAARAGAKSLVPKK